MTSEARIFRDSSQWREPLLETLRSIPILRRAARRVGIDPSRVYQVMREDPEFKKAVEEAQAEGDDSLEVAAFKRGVKGVMKGVWHNGMRVGEERVYSDTLLMGLLKGRKKHIYADRTELTGADGEPLGLGPMDETAKAARLASLLKLAADRKAAADVCDDLC